MITRMNLVKSTLLNVVFVRNLKTHTSLGKNFTFNEYQVDTIPNFSFSKSHIDKIDIAFDNATPLEELPYADQYPIDELTAYELKRFNHSIIVARGVPESPDQIFEVGGFHPLATHPHSLKKHGEEILEVFSHRQNSAGSGLVSFTSSLNHLLSFSSIKYIYFAMIKGAIGPHPRILNEEQEYSAPGGIDADDIIAYREKRLSNSFNQSSIFLSQSFEYKYPEKVIPVIASYLRRDEFCKLKDETITQGVVNPRLLHQQGFFSANNKNTNLPHIENLVPSIQLSK